MKLNLGAGKLDIRKGYINLDKTNYPNIDVVWDLNTLPLPFEDNQFEEILAYSILEHVNYVPLMDELHRILESGGILRIRTPHFTYVEAYTDPTHVNHFSYLTFFYFKKGLAREYSFCKFSDFGGKITFQKRLIFPWNYILEWFVNLGEWSKKLYEKTPLRIFPAANLEVWLRK
mgnify:CR=1 FL=1